MHKCVLISIFPKIQQRAISSQKGSETIFPNFSTTEFLQTFLSSFCSFCVYLRKKVETRVLKKFSKLSARIPNLLIAYSKLDNLLFCFLLSRLCHSTTVSLFYLLFFIYFYVLHLCFYVSLS